MNSLNKELKSLFTKKETKIKTCFDAKKSFIFLLR